MRYKGISLMPAGAAFSLAFLMAAGAALAKSDVPLVEAARNQDPQRVRALLAQRADVNARSADGSTALLWAGAIRSATEFHAACLEFQ
jgi:hypothetical protein